MRALLAAFLCFGCAPDQFSSGDGGDDGSSVDGPSLEASAPDGAGGCNLDAGFIVTPLADLDTDSDESALRLTPDGLFGVFQSNRLDNQDNDLYSTSRSSLQSAFMNVTALTSLNQGTEDTDPTLSHDGLTIYFASNRSGNFDIWTSTRGAVSDNNFGMPTKVAFDTNEDEIQPYLTPDGQNLYLSARRTVTDTTFDIYHSTLSSGTWTTLTAVGGVNSLSDDDAPVVTNDGLTMYFASARNNHQMDIYVARRANPSATFGTPQPVVELNDSMNDDRPSYVTGDGCKLLFHSNRPSTKNGFNIFLASKP